MFLLHIEISGLRRPALLQYQPLNPTELGTIIQFFCHARNYKKSARSQSYKNQIHVNFTRAALLRLWVCVSRQYNIGPSTKVGFHHMAHLQCRYTSVITNDRETTRVPWLLSIDDFYKPRSTCPGPNNVQERQLKVDRNINTFKGGVHHTGQLYVDR